MKNRRFLLRYYCNPSSWGFVNVGIQSHWYDRDQSIILSNVTELWTWEDVHDNRQVILEMAKSVNHPVALIVLLPVLVSIPPRGFAQELRQATLIHHEAGLYRIAYVCPNPTLRPLLAQSISTFALYPPRYQVGGKLEEVLSLFDSDTVS